MKILVISDFVEKKLYDHFQPEKFPNIDLILSCGDLPPEYLSFLAAGLKVPLYYVRGNHDFRHNGYHTEGCIDLDARLVRHQGLRILGLEGSNWYNGKSLQYTEKQMRHKILRLYPKLWWHKGVDIVITHASPRHIHDAEDPCHKGFECFCRFIERYTPRYFIHGHMHFNYTLNPRRFTVVNKTRVINGYGHYIIEIDDHENAG